MARISDKLKFPAFLAANGRCTYCGLDASTNVSVFCAMEVDHVPPFASKLSQNTPDGVVYCCPHCNKMLASYKHVLTVEERRAIIQKGLIEKKRVWFDPWMDELRKRDH